MQYFFHFRWARNGLLGFFLISCLSTPVMAKANRPITPETIQGGTIIDANQAQTLLQTKRAVFFDTRSALNYGRGHVPGAVCLPYKENSRYAEDFDASLDQVDLGQLPEDKRVAIVFYSHGNTGWKSYKTAAQAISSGYTQVYWFREGFSSWLAKGLAAE